MTMKTKGAAGKNKIALIGSNAQWNDFAPEISKVVGFPPLRKLRVGISKKA
jgi:hypothetical protein